MECSDAFSRNLASGCLGLYPEGYHIEIPTKQCTARQKFSRD